MDEILNKLKQKIIEKTDCDCIILFGSFARGTQNSESDIDIAFKTNKKLEKMDIFYLKQELEDIAKRDVDLVDLDAVGDVFKYEILISGNTLYCVDEMKLELYKLNVYRDFFDLNERRNLIVERVKNGGTIYGK